jgi:ketosteroid isomerase-like protein
MRRLGWQAAALMLAATAVQAQAAALTPTAIINRHMAAAQNRDVDAMMADYAEDTVVMTGGRATQGKAAVRQQFAGMFGPKPANAAAPAPGAVRPPEMKIGRVWQEGDVGFVTWTQGPVSATEEFLVRGGKILVQAIFMNGAPGGPPKPN